MEDSTTPELTEAENTQMVITMDSSLHLQELSSVVALLPH